MMPGAVIVKRPLAALIAAVMLTACSRETAPTAGGQHSILLVTLDTTRADRSGPRRRRGIDTPAPSTRSPPEGDAQPPYATVPRNVPPTRR